jgi:hypothetical protein
MTSNDIKNKLNKLVDTFNENKIVEDKIKDIERCQKAELVYKELLDECLKEAGKGKRNLCLSKKIDKQILPIVAEYFSKENIIMTHKGKCVDSDCYALCYCSTSSINIEW